MWIIESPTVQCKEGKSKVLHSYPAIMYVKHFSASQSHQINTMPIGSAYRSSLCMTFFSIVLPLALVRFLAGPGGCPQTVSGAGYFFF